MIVRAMLLCLVLATAGAKQVTVVGPGPRQETVDTRLFEAVEHVPVRMLSVLLSARQSWQAELRRLTLEFDGGPLVIVAGSPFVAIGSRMIQLPTPVLLRSGEIWVPISFFQEPATGLTGLGLEWIAEERVLTRRTGEYTLERVSLEGWGDTLAVMLSVSGTPEADVELEPEEIVIALHQTRIGRDVARRLSGGGPARSIEISEDLQGTTVRVRLSGDAGSWFDLREGEGVLKVWRKAAITQAPLLTRSETPVVVVDPGHGGRDPGALGKGGLREKWVTLKTARLVREELMKLVSPVRVVLTRKGDVMMPLRDRADVANKERADVFLSLHANYSYNRDAHGLETYFLSVAKTDEERAVAAMENAPLAREASWEGGGSSEELEFILWDSAQSAWLDQSASLAAHVQKLAAQRGLGSRGVKQAGFYVLSGAYMPAVLVEVGFLSNREEEHKLKDERHLRKVAQVLAEGVASFLRMRERAP